MKSKLTIKQLADLAGVSIGTVDRALNNRSGISEETKNKILKIAQDYDYKTNKLASALVRQKSIRIGIVAPFSRLISLDIENGMKQAQYELSDFNIQLKFFYTKDFEPKKQIEVLEQINLDEFDALLINACGESVEKYFERYFESNIPVATFNSDITTPKRLFFIGQDSYKAGALAAGMLRYSLKEDRKVAIFTGFCDVESHKQRCCGFIDELGMYFKNLDFIGPLEYFDDEKYAYNVAYEQFLKYGEEIQTVFTTTAPGTVGIIKAAKEVYQKDLPQIIGYDFNEYVKEFLIQDDCFAVIYQSPFVQGYYAVKMLVDHIVFGWTPKGDNIFVAPRIILKQNIDEFEDSREDLSNYIGLNFLNS